jgi:hypothetical protein
MPSDDRGTELLPTEPVSDPDYNVIIRRPANGTTVSGELTALAAVSGEADVVVDGYLDSTLLKTENSEPYEFMIDTTRYSDGEHKFKATARSEDGQVRSAVVIFRVDNSKDASESPDIPDSQPLPPSNLTLPSAEDVFLTENFSVPDEVGNFLILIPNEAHHLDMESDSFLPTTNRHYLPTRLEISSATNVTLVSNDSDHFHTTLIRDSDLRPVVETTEIDYAEYTEPIIFRSQATGGYGFSDLEYDDMHGYITVRDPSKPASGIAVGCIYVPQVDISKFRQSFANHGFAIESEYSFTWDNSNQSIDEQTLIVFSTHQPLPIALEGLSDIVKDTPYS